MVFTTLLRRQKLFFWDPHSGFQEIQAENAVGNIFINNNGIIVGTYGVYDNKKGYKEFLGYSIFQWDKKNGFADIGLKAAGHQHVLDIN